MRKTPSLFRQMVPYLDRAAKGKITVHTLSYRFGTEGYTNPQGVHFKPFVDDNGRSIELFQCRCSECPDPSLHPDLPVVSGRVSVPVRKCRECPNRLKNNCCRLLRGDGRRSIVIFEKTLAEELTNLTETKSPI